MAALEATHGLSSVSDLDRDLHEIKWEFKQPSGKIAILTSAIKRVRPTQQQQQQQPLSRGVQPGSWLQHASVMPGRSSTWAPGRQGQELLDSIEGQGRQQ